VLQSIYPFDVASSRLQGDETRRSVSSSREMQSPAEQVEHAMRLLGAIVPRTFPLLVAECGWWFVGDDGLGGEMGRF